MSKTGVWKKHEPYNGLLLTREQAAQALGISTYLVDRLRKEGRLRFVMVGDLVRIPKPAIDEFLAKPS